MIVRCLPSISSATVSLSSPPAQTIPFGLFDVPRDEVVVHVEQANSEEIEHDIQAMSQRHGFVVSLAEGSQSSLLAKHFTG